MLIKRTRKFSGFCADLNRLLTNRLFYSLCHLSNVVVIKLESLLNALISTRGPDLKFLFSLDVLFIWKRYRL